MLKSKLIAGAIVIGCFLLIFLGAMAFVNLTNVNQLPEPNANDSNTNQSDPDKQVQLIEADVKMLAFKSEQDFKDYLSKNPIGSGTGFGAESFATADMAPIVPDQKSSANLETGTAPTIESPDRFSQTNVQELSIDEPDIVKNDGINIYFSQQNRNWIMNDLPRETTGNGSADVAVESKTATKPSIAPMPPVNNLAEIKLIKAFEPSEMKVLGKIEGWGNLLLKDNILMVLSSESIIAYDITKAEDPKESWKLKFNNQRSNLVQSRLMDDTLYLVLRQNIDGTRPCPIQIMETGGAKIEFSCEEIYHPASNFSASTVYTIMALNAKTGEIKNKTAYVGNPNNTVVYMSKDFLYLTYSFYPDPVAFVYDFFTTKCQGLVPPQIVEKLKKLMDYDISSQSKMTEFSLIMDEYQRTLDADQRLMLENELTNRMQSYFEEHQRDLSKTGIVKISTKDLRIAGSGTIPGTPLNQFSLDEYNGNLRIATTIGGSMFGANAQQVSDVYVLDDSLKILSAVKDLGKGERIYSGRFVKDRGYVVTFRQIDPFYVLDLSNPAKAELKGELKIPGFSSYLHPIDANTILGIGQENNNVKISLFDVSDPSNPTEKSKYNLKDYWSEVSNNHHAFLLDSKHQIFFLPGSQGGYIMSYQDSSLTLKKAVSDYQTKRAVYINDFLYLISENQIVVFDENTWEKTNELSFE